SLFNAHSCFEHRPVEREGVELAPLTAWVDMVRQISQKLLVEVTSGKAEGQLLRIYAGNHSAQPARNHLVRQVISWRLPEWKQRTNAGAGQFRFSIFFYVGEKQITERHAFNPARLRLVDKFLHRCFVLRISARTGQVDDQQRKTQRVGL